MSKAVGIYVIIGGVLLGIAMAVFIAGLLSEVGDAGGGTTAFTGLLTFVGVSATTIGIGVLVILAGQILDQMKMRNQ